MGDSDAENAMLDQPLKGDNWIWFSTGRASICSPSWHS